MSKLKFKTHLDLMTEKTILDYLHEQHPSDKTAIRLSKKFCRKIRMKDLQSIWSVFWEPVDTPLNRRNQLGTQTIRNIEAAIKECHASVDQRFYSIHDKTFLKEAEKEIKKRRARASRRTDRVGNHMANEHNDVYGNRREDEEVLHQKDKVP